MYIFQKMFITVSVQLVNAQVSLSPPTFSELLFEREKREGRKNQT